jgi:membrane protease subunit HflK
MEGLLAGRRREAERATLLEVQRRADACGLGLVIDAVAYQDIHPPLLVADAYHDVSRAGSDRARRTNEGTTYRLEQVKAAEGRAAISHNGAEADRLGRSTRAAGDADAFVALVRAREAFPALTDHRLYWEALALVLSNKPKLILDPDKARRRHLILPDFPLGGDPAMLKAAVAPPPAEPARP